MEQEGGRGVNRINRIIREYGVAVFAIRLFEASEREQDLRRELIHRTEQWVIISRCIRKGYKRVEAEE